ncbi:MAG: site-2 protease family protein [Nitrososphaerota archaeon]
MIGLRFPQIYFFGRSRKLLKSPAEFSTRKVLEYYSELEELKRAVSEHFTVENVFYEAGILTFQVAEREIKDRFRKLYKDLRRLGYLPAARLQDGKVVIRVFGYREPALGWMRYRNLPLILFIATLAAVFVDGFLRASSPGYDILLGERSILDKFLEASLFMIFLMMIIGLHELGHLASARRSGMEATLPYFIPGIPGMIPTFGAVIFQKEPIINRDDMFDLGISGPIMSFIISLLVSIFVVKVQTLWLTEAEYLKVVEAIKSRGGSFLPAPLIMELIMILSAVPGKVPLIAGVTGFAAWLGFLVTALNLLPIWQLDGSKIFRSLLTPRQHRIASYISLAFLAVMGYFFIAILFLLLMSRMPDIPPLDEVSPLSRGRKLLFAAVLLMIALSFVPAYSF